MTGMAGAEELDGRGGRHHHLDPRATWCSYHQASFTTPIDHRLAGGRSGTKQERRSTPRGNLRRRPGDGVGGVGGPAGSRGASPSLLTSRASWCSYHREALTSLRVRLCWSQGWRPWPSRLAGGDAVPESPTVCRRWIGSPESRPALPEADRDPGPSRFAGGGLGTGRQHQLDTAGQLAEPTR
jgi:hypothetical protein